LATWLMASFFIEQAEEKNKADSSMAPAEKNDLFIVLFSKELELLYY
jgi:hypothetical protein